jgi:hypothetical protein
MPSEVSEGDTPLNRIEIERAPSFAEWVNAACGAFPAREYELLLLKTRFLRIRRWKERQYPNPMRSLWPVRICCKRPRHRTTNQSDELPSRQDKSRKGG